MPSSIVGSVSGAVLVMLSSEGWLIWQGDADPTADPVRGIDYRDGAVVQLDDPARDGQAKACAAVPSGRVSTRETFEHPVPLQWRDARPPIRHVEDRNV